MWIFFQWRQKWTIVYEPREHEDSVAEKRFGKDITIVEFPSFSDRNHGNGYKKERHWWTHYNTFLYETREVKWNVSCLKQHLIWSQSIRRWRTLKLEGSSYGNWEALWRSDLGHRCLYPTGCLWCLFFQTGSLFSKVQSVSSESSHTAGMQFPTRKTDGAKDGCLLGRLPLQGRSLIQGNRQSQWSVN